MQLNRRTRYVAIRAENAAVAGQRIQQRMTARAFVKPLAGVDGHGFSLDVATARTGQRGLQGGIGIHVTIVVDARLNLTICAR